MGIFTRFALYHDSKVVSSKILNLTIIWYHKSRLAMTDFKNSKLDNNVMHGLSLLLMLKSMKPPSMFA